MLFYAGVVRPGQALQSLVWSTVCVGVWRATCEATLAFTHVGKSVKKLRTPRLGPHAGNHCEVEDGDYSEAEGDPVDQQ